MAISYIDRPNTWVEPLSGGYGLRNPIDDLSLAMTPQPEGMMPWSYYVPPFLARDTLLAPGYDALRAIGRRVDLKVLSSPLDTVADLGPTEPGSQFTRLVEESHLVVYSLGRPHPNGQLEDVRQPTDGRGEGAPPDVSRELATGLNIYDRIQDVVACHGNAACARVDFGLLHRGESMHGDEVPPPADRTMQDMYSRGMSHAGNPSERLVVDLVMTKLKSLRNVGAVGLVLKRFVEVNADWVFDSDDCRIKLLYITGATSHYIFKGMRGNYAMKTQGFEAVEPSGALRHAAMILDSCIIHPERDVPILLDGQDPVQPN